MANTNKDNTNVNSYFPEKDKKLIKNVSTIDNLINSANMTIYGINEPNNDVDRLNVEFKKLLNDHINGITNTTKEDLTSFLGDMINNDNKHKSNLGDISSIINGISTEQNSTLQSYIYDAYKNRLLAQSDLHEVASQIIELSEAVMIMRDAMITPDTIEGRINRNIIFKNMETSDVDEGKKIVENLENRYDLQEKIKNFIIPKTLEYGEYYVYCIPYSDLFEQYEKIKKKDRYHNESVNLTNIMTESVDSKAKKNDLSLFIEATYTEYIKDMPKESIPDKKEFSKDITDILSRISVSNDIIPIPLIENGESGIDYIFAKKENSNNSTKNIFESNIDSDMKRNNDNDYTNIGECYIKLIPPTKIVPMKIMDSVIGYLYVIEEDMNILNGSVSSNLYYTKYGEHRRETSIIDAIAEKVVKSFDKSFLMDNVKFKKVIADCLEYYNINDKGIKFQFIPAEYMVEFKIDKDEDGNGQSMIKKSLFYAKLYLMLLLFNIMTMITNGNDTKVNYVKSAGIDKDVASKIQEIMRIKQSRQINITDLFSYTTLINKVGKGSEAYIPVGRSGERPVETEILQGQDVNLHSELLEFLKNGAILGTGVPAALINYLNEPDFATQVMQNHSKFNARVVNYQLDMNPQITKLYKLIMKSSNIIDDIYINNFEFALQIPKVVLTNTKVDAVNSFNSIKDFAVQLIYGDPNTDPNPDYLQKKIREFTILFAKEQLPMLNIDKLISLSKEAEINAMKAVLSPNPSNGDSGDDIGLEDLENNLDDDMPI